MIKEVNSVDELFSRMNANANEFDSIMSDLRQTLEQVRHIYIKGEMLKEQNFDMNSIIHQYHNKENTEYPKLENEPVDTKSQYGMVNTLPSITPSVDKDSTVDQETLYETIGEIIDRIESCGASPELTHAVTLACDLRRAIGNQFNPADRYALSRVLDALKKD